MSKTRPKPRPAPPRPRVVAPAGSMAAEIERRAVRQEHRRQVRVAAARQRRRTRLRTGTIAGLVVLAVGSVIAFGLMQEANKPGEAVGQQPSPHLAALTSPHAPYSTDPPTSGPHTQDLPSWGAATTPVPRELQVHGLEDGAVIISYQPTLEAAVLTRLSALTMSYGTRVILTPAPGLVTPIVLTAWGRMQRFAQYDEQAIRRFVNTYRGIDHHKDSRS